MYLTYGKLIGQFCRTGVYRVLALAPLLMLDILPTKADDTTPPPPPHKL